MNRKFSFTLSSFVPSAFTLCQLCHNPHCSFCIYLTQFVKMSLAKMEEVALSTVKSLQSFCASVQIFTMEHSVKTTLVSKLVYFLHLTYVQHELLIFSAKCITWMQ